jgi:hypothetical protein
VTGLAGALRPPVTFQFLDQPLAQRQHAFLAPWERPLLSRM